MTTKTLAKPEGAKSTMHQNDLLTEEGQRFRFRRHVTGHNPRIGEKQWVARRLNVPAHRWCFELYRITVEEDPRNPGTPRIHLGIGREFVMPL